MLEQVAPSRGGAKDQQKEKHIVHSMLWPMLACPLPETTSDNIDGAGHRGWALK